MVELIPQKVIVLLKAKWGPINNQFFCNEFGFGEKFYTYLIWIMYEF